MKKLLLSGSIATLLLPSLAFAAYNDVTLTTDVVFSVNGITINATSSTGTIESIEVGSDSFSVDILANSSFKVTAPNLNKLSASTGQGQDVNICNSTESTLGYNLLGTSETITVTIVPSTTLCADPTEVASSSRTDEAGGGGGGVTTVATPVVAPIVVVGGANAEAIAAIKSQLIVLIQELISILIQQLQVEIQALQTSGSY
ncbi:MAG: hypothetical protein Q7R69_02200 [bacterium]|nr:hypothetical protein [bacterium]